MIRHTMVTAALALSLGAATFCAAAGVNAEDRAEAAAVGKASVSPTRAVQIAEQAGGRAYAFGMESTPHANWYEVEVLRNNQPTEVRIDPMSGKVFGTSKARGADVSGAHALDGSALTLGAAIGQAERMGNGTAMEATSLGRGDTAHVIVDVVQGKTIAHYRASMTAGQIHVVKTRQGA